MADNSLSQKLAELRQKAPETAAEIEKALANTEKKFGTTTEAALRLADALTKGADAQKALNTSLEETYQNYLKVYTEAEKSQLADKVRIESYKKLNALVEDNQKLTEKDKKEFKETLDAQEKQLESAQKQKKSVEGTTKAIQEQKKEVKGASEEWSLLEKAAAAAAGIFIGTKVTSKLVKSQKVAQKGIKATTTATTKATKATKNLDEAAKAVSKTGKAGAAVKGGILGGLLTFGASKAGDALGGATTKLQQLIDHAKETYLNVSDLTTGFSSLTGQVMNSDSAVRRGGKGMATFSSRVIQLQRRNQMLGATIEDVTKAYSSMITVSRTFGKAMSSSRAANRMVADSLAETAFRLTKAGLSTETFGAAVDVLGKTYRTSKIISRSKSLGAQFVNIARVTGQLPEQIGKDFVNAMDVLSAYSLPKAQSIFKKLSATVAETGVGMDKLLNIAGKFDDIEAAAGSVGELNAMLGGPYLNTLDMVNASEEERIEMLKNSMSESGQSFNQMDRFMKKAIAAQLGTDVQAASRIFGAQQGAIDATTKAIDTQGASFKSLVGGVKDGAARNATSIRQQQKAVEEGTVLMEGAFSAVDRMARKAMGTFRMMGSRFRKEIGGGVVGAMRDVEKYVGALDKNLREGNILTAMAQASVLALPDTLKATILAGKQILGGSGGGTGAPAETVNEQAQKATATPHPQQLDRYSQRYLQENPALGAQAGLGMSGEELMQFAERVKTGEIVINIDGQEVARAVHPHMSTATMNPGGLG